MPTAALSRSERTFPCGRHNLPDYLNLFHTWLPRGGRVGRVLPAVVADTAKAEGVALGKAEGKAEGRAEGNADDSLMLLSCKGEIPEELSETILGEKKIERLNAWLIAAAKAGSVSDFRKECGI